jgi:GNAT superfamily N-acetyltransferase
MVLGMKADHTRQAAFGAAGEVEIQHECGQYLPGYAWHEFVAQCDGVEVASLLVNVDDCEPFPVVDDVHVEAGWRRQNLATRLFRHAQQVLGPIGHSGAVTPDGAAWVAALH